MKWTMASTRGGVKRRKREKQWRGRKNNSVARSEAGKDEN